MTDFMYTVGTGSIAEGIDELILGLKAGEELKMNAPVGDGVIATYELQLKQVQERVLPELTDEWVAGELGVGSAEEMRERSSRRCAVAKSSRPRCPSVTPR